MRSSKQAQLGALVVQIVAAGRAISRRTKPTVHLVAAIGDQ
jgi:hypothetical protein